MTSAEQTTGKPVSIRFAPDILEAVAAVAAAETSGVFSDAVRILLLEALGNRQDRPASVSITADGQQELERIARHLKMPVATMVRQGLRYACVHYSAWADPVEERF